VQVKVFPFFQAIFKSHHVTAAGADDPC
jgi:hypothetical protein